MTAGRRHATRAAAAAAVAALLAAPTPARPGPPTDAVLHLAATSLAWSPGGVLAGGRPAPALAIRLAPEEADPDAGPYDRLPGWVRSWIARWDPWDGSGYRLHPRDGLSFIGAYERPSGVEPLVIEPDEEPDSPRARLVGDAAYTTFAMLDLSELPRLLLALGGGGGRTHLHAYLGWQVTLGTAAAVR